MYNLPVIFIRTTRFIQTLWEYKSFEDSKIGIAHNRKCVRVHNENGFATGGVICNLNSLCVLNLSESPLISKWWILLHTFSQYINIFWSKMSRYLYQNDNISNVILIYHFRPTSLHILHVNVESYTFIKQSL